MHMSFARWLQHHRAEDTPLGDLARTAHYARIRAHALDAWEEQLHAQGASQGVLNLLHTAWEQYERGVAPPEQRKLPIEDRDAPWTITRPALPNWKGFPPALMQVRRDPLPAHVTSPIHTVCGAVFMEAVEQYGRYFRREFSYDFVPYTMRAHVQEGDEQLAVYLFFDRHDGPTCTMRPLGACGFWYVPELSGWGLGWIWFHPFARRRGYLRAVWPVFRRHYGNFPVQRPLSAAMASFLQHVDSAETSDDVASPE